MAQPKELGRHEGPVEAAYRVLAPAFDVFAVAHDSLSASLQRASLRESFELTREVPLNGDPGVTARLVYGVIGRVGRKDSDFGLKVIVTDTNRRSVLEVPFIPPVNNRLNGAH